MIKKSSIVDKMRANLDPFVYADHRPGTTPIPKSSSSKMCMQRTKNCLVLERDMGSLEKKSLDVQLSAVQATKAVDGCAELFAARREAETDWKEDELRAVHRSKV